MLYPTLLELASRVVVEPVLGEHYCSRARSIARWWAQPDGDREQWRSDQLTSMLAYASGHVPAYGWLPADGTIALDELPVIDKQTIFGDETAFRSDEHHTIPSVEKHTGGSTGDPWNYPLDRAAWAESYATQIYRYRQLGVAYGERRVLLGFPASLGLQRLNWQKRLRLGAERVDVSLCGFDVGPVASLDRAERACEKKAAMWYGYASTIAAMAAAVLDTGRPMRGPRLIVTMAEPLWPNWHSDIGEAFGSRVIEEYGCNDGGIMSHRCDEGNLHLADHQSIVEVLDDEGLPCPIGVDGSIVVTNLHARHMPFLRYTAGDRGALGPVSCLCGLPGRTLKRVAGRTGDLIRLPDGSELVPATFFNPFNEVAAVRRWQMVQPDPGQLVIRIEPRSAWLASDEAKIRDWVETQTRHQLAVSITIDEEFELTNGGKHKMIVRAF